MIDLHEAARSLFAPGKGILAADESITTADKRLALYGIPTGPAMRQAMRELFLETPGSNEYLSGVILHEETFGQSADSGTLFRESLGSRGIAPGIKVDGGTEPFPDSPQELITSGLIGLPERLAYFKEQGAVFTKWRAVLRIEGDRLPSDNAIVENAKRLASYACEAQKAGLVPILEPEVLLDGDHSRLRAHDVIARALEAVFAALADQSVDASGIIIKTAMALTGKDTKHVDSPEEVAESTLDALMKSVPAETGGIVFLSGGQSPDQATANLAAICKRAKSVSAPWPLTFSYARALQHDALTIWKGDALNVLAARAAFLARLQSVSCSL